MFKKILILLLIALSAFSIILLCRTSSKQEEISATVLADSQFEPYLNLKGLEGEKLSDEQITIPESFTGVYKDFADIQKAAGFDLSSFKGKQVRRVTYLITNYSSDTEVIAELLLYGDKLISAALIENKPDGFISPLK
jgi:hypothetical protein